MDHQSLLRISSANDDGDRSSEIAEKLLASINQMRCNMAHLRAIAYLRAKYLVRSLIIVAALVRA